MKILDRLQSDRPALVSFLDVARVKIDGTRLIIRFEQMFYVEALKEAANEKALKDAVHAVLGDAATVDVRMAEGTDVKSSSLAEIRQAERKDFEDKRLERVKEHPAVKLAVDIFGARIREVKGPSDG